MVKGFGRLGLALLALLQVGLVHAAVVSWLPPQKAMSVGEIGYVDLLFNRTVGDTGPLGAFNVLLQFNPTVVRFDAAASSLTPEGRDNNGLLPNQLSCPGLQSSCPFWGSLGFITGQTDDNDGTIELTEVSLAPSADLALQARGFLLMRLAFEGRTLGTSSLDFLQIDLSDADGSALTLLSQPSAQLSVIIPEPTSVALVLLALWGCANVSRRRTRQTPPFQALSASA